jgi:hypothetical protein
MIDFEEDENVPSRGTDPEDGLIEDKYSKQDLEEVSISTKEVHAQATRVTVPKSIITRSLLMLAVDESIIIRTKDIRNLAAMYRHSILYHRRFRVKRMQLFDVKTTTFEKCFEVTRVK